MRFLTKPLAIVTCSVLSSLSLDSQVSLYFSAHEDDWQLFMGINAYNDMQALQYNPTYKVVIIHTTAGDAGVGMTGGYVAARENCSMNSVKFAASPGSAAPPYGGVGVSTTVINGHPILTKTYGDVTSYFLRLPDGCGNVAGCPPSNSGSLEGFSNGVQTSFTARDNSTTYTGWQDLVQTVRVLITAYCGQNSAGNPGMPLWINIPDAYTGLNPGDHPDHMYTAKLAVQAAGEQCCIYYAAYVDYHSNTLSPNMSTSEIENESALYGACSLGLADGGQNSNWEPWHTSFLDRNYYRIWHNECLGGKMAGATGVPTELNFEEKYSFYPVPVSDRLNVKYTMAGVEQEVVKIEIQDVLGKHTVKSQEGQSFIETGDLKAGIYFAKIYSSPDNFIIRKFIKE